MRKNIFFILFLSVFNLSAQKRDNTWILGYYAGEPGPTEDTLFGIQRIFFDNTLNITKKSQLKIQINEGNANISDKEGNLLFFSNGENLFNKNLDLANGENNINWDSTTFLTAKSTPQICLFLPFPADESKTLFFSKKLAVLKVGSSKRIINPELNLAILQNQGVNGLGEVITRRINVLKDTLCEGKITAVKHGNGRDWWMVIQRYLDNKYYKILVNHIGVRVNDLQEIGIDKTSLDGQAVFSPDGKFYVNYDCITQIKDPHLTIFDFDRCTGQLSNPRNIFYDKEISIGGVAVSPNSRFLYASFYGVLMQYDLWAKDIAASKKDVALYDYAISGTNFYLAQLAPDGKIYMSTNGASPYLHVINNPDEEGTACNFKLRGLKLPYYNAWGIPNHPNYRLGALKGSPCDSLGIVAVQELKEENFKVYPNPASDILNIELPLSMSSATILLRDIQGRLLKSIAAKGATQIDISDLYNGLIFVEIWSENRRIATKKVIIMN